jgi:hypothetical protein
MPAEQVLGSENTFRIHVDKLDGGWSTRTIPTQLPDNKLAIADNVVYSQDGLVSKRPGNIPYGSVNALPSTVYGSGAIYGQGELYEYAGHLGSGQPILALTRFYPNVRAHGILYAQSGGQLWQGNDANGSWTAVAGITLSSTRAACFTPMYDPDMSTGAATALFITDGVHLPQIYDGTNVAAVQTGGVFLPNGRTGAPITPLYSCNWDYHLCYAGEPTEPSALYISDALRPERFTGVNYIDSALSSYVPYYPAGRDGALGRITGIVPLNAVLLIFFEQGVVIASNTGSYGATQYQFSRLSSIVGAVSPRSIVAMDSAVFFFGGDRFYATDSQSIAPLADDLPSLYTHTSRSISPPEISDACTVVGVRRGSQYWACYDSVAGGKLGRIVVFDTAANGGWQFPSTAVVTSAGFQQGGAWSRWPTGMTLGAAVECRGPYDSSTFPFFWGSSRDDIVAQHDTGVFADFNAPITFEARSKSFYLEKPLSHKTLQGMYVLCVFDVGSTPATFAISPYVVEDYATVAAYAQPITLPGTDAGFTLIPIKAYAQQIGPCTAIGVGIVESSKTSFAIVGLVLEVTVDPVAP